MSITTKTGEALAFTMGGREFLKMVRGSDKLFDAHVHDIIRAANLI